LNIRLADFNKHVAIAGFREVKLEDVNRFFQAVKDKTENACVQFFDASLIAGWEHLHFAVLNTLNAFKSKANISSSTAMETLLYASAQRQIKEAVRLIGIKPSTRHVAVLIIAKTPGQAESVLRVVSQLLGGRPDDSVVELTDAKTDGVRKLFDLSNAELESKLQREGFEKQALVDMVIEHMALLVTRR